MDYKGSLNEVIKKHGTDAKRGLTSSEAKARLEKYGPNAIESSNKKSLMKKIIEQIADPMVILLVIAAIVSAFTDGRWRSRSVRRLLRAIHRTEEWWLISPI